MGIPFLLKAWWSSSRTCCKMHDRLEKTASGSKSGDYSVSVALSGSLGKSRSSTMLSPVLVFSITDSDSRSMVNRLGDTKCNPCSGASCPHGRASPRSRRSTHFVIRTRRAAAVDELTSLSIWSRTRHSRALSDVQAICYPVLHHPTGSPASTCTGVSGRSGTGAGDPGSISVCLYRYKSTVGCTCISDPDWWLFRIQFRGITIVPECNAVMQRERTKTYLQDVASTSIHEAGR